MEEYNIQHHEHESSLHDLNVELNYPMINDDDEILDTTEDSDKMESTDEEEDSDIENISVRVTNFARRQYLNHIEKLLKMNYESWYAHTHESGVKKSPPKNLLKICAQDYEENALKSCMNMQIYRKTILKFMAEIRRQTVHSRLVNKFKQIQKKKANDMKENMKNFKSIGTQTNSDSCLTGIQEIRYECLSLQEKIVYFQNQLNEHENKMINDTNVKSNNGETNKSINNNSYCKSLSSKNHKSKKLNNYKHQDQCNNHQCSDDMITTIKSRKRRISETEQNNENEIIASSLTSFTPPPPPSSSVNEINTSVPVVVAKKPNIENFIVPKPLTSQIIDDEIDKELEELLGENTNNIEEEIFGDDTYHTKVEQILKEIENSNVPLLLQPIDHHDNISHYNDEEVANTSPEIDNIIHNDDDEYHQKNNTNNNNNNVKKMNLYDGLWPCELYMRECELRSVLTELSDHKGIRCYEKIRQRFCELFGDDSDDEFAPYSPTIETNDILLYSCKKRIASWIVKYLMIPMEDGLIGDRFLFKKLAKRLAHSIITINFYPDENTVKEVIEEFFCRKRAINCLKDIDEINLEASASGSFD